MLHNNRYATLTDRGWGGDAEIKFNVYYLTPLRHNFSKSQKSNSEFIRICLKKFEISKWKQMKKND